MSWFPDDERIERLYPLARDGDALALRELRAIYERGEFDPGFGLPLEAFLERNRANEALKGGKR